MVNLLALLNLQSVQAACSRVLGITQSVVGLKGGKTRVMERCVNKVDCLIGCRVMNVVVIHLLKGHTMFLLT